MVTFLIFYAKNLKKILFFKNKIFNGGFMRIITGKHKGRKLNTLPGKNTRPMMDRMKESIFNIIGPYFDGGIVLDLFGGSGALTLESISRGANKAYIVEKNGAAINVIKSNVEMLKEEDNINLLAMDYKLVLEYAKNNNLKFDLIFLDPPFRMKVIDDIVEYILENNLINNDGYIICQFPKGNHEIKERNNLYIRKHDQYSASEVVIYNYQK